MLWQQRTLTILTVSCRVPLGRGCRQWQSCRWPVHTGSQWAQSGPSQPQINHSDRRKYRSAYLVSSLIELYYMHALTVQKLWLHGLAHTHTHKRTDAHTHKHTQPSHNPWTRCCGSHRPPKTCQSQDWGSSVVLEWRIPSALHQHPLPPLQQMRSGKKDFRRCKQN